MEENIENYEVSEQTKATYSIDAQKKQKLIALALIAVSALGFFFYANPTNSDLGDLQAQLQPVQQEESLLLERLSKLQEAEAQLEAKSDVSIFDLTSKIPEKLDQDELLLNLVEIAEKKDIQFQSIGFGISAESEEEVKELSINASFEGNYGTLISFLKALEQSGRKIVIESISVQILGEAFSGINRVHFSLAMKSFYRDSI